MIYNQDIWFLSPKHFVSHVLGLEVGRVGWRKVLLRQTTATTRTCLAARF